MSFNGARRVQKIGRQVKSGLRSSIALTNRSFRLVSQEFPEEFFKVKEEYKIL